MNRHWRGILWIVVSLLTGCSSTQKNNSDAAIRQAIEQHLAGRQGLANDQIVLDLKQVQIQGDKADADVIFHSRSDSNVQMTFHYQLTRDGQGWKVSQGRPSASDSPHPSGPEVQGQQPEAGGSAPPPAALPQGHSPVPK